MHSLAIPRLVKKALLLMRNAYRILLGYSIHAISNISIHALKILYMHQIWIKVAFFGGVVEASVSGKASL